MIDCATRRRCCGISPMRAGLFSDPELKSKMIAKFVKITSGFIRFTLTLTRNDDGSRSIAANVILMHISTATLIRLNARICARRTLSCTGVKLPWDGAGALPCATLAGGSTSVLIACWACRPMNLVRIQCTVDMLLNNASRYCWQVLLLLSSAMPYEGCRQPSLQALAGSSLANPGTTPCMLQPLVPSSCMGSDDLLATDNAI